jgi:HEAT repeat protein
VDVAFDKLADAVGAGVIGLVLAVGLSTLVSNRVLTLVAAVLGIASFILTMRLRSGYVATLEKSLLNQAADLDLIDTEERTTRETLFRTLGTVDLSAIERSKPSVAEAPPEPVVAGIDAGSAEKLILDLQSVSTKVVRSALAKQEPLDPLLIAPVIRLLARDDVSENALQVLRKTVATTVGQLTDALLNADEDFAIRRRIPRVLAHCRSARAVEGLMRGLADSRFEVRFSCGRGLSRICSIDEALRPPVESVYTATLREITIAERLSEMPRVLDQYEDHADSTSTRTLWNSTDIRLEHIFRLLSLSLHREPLHIAFRALHTNDTYLRGTALEYLESILPTGIRERLLEFIEGPFRPIAKGRPTDNILEELLKSRQHIEQELSFGGRAPLSKNP